MTKAIYLDMDGCVCNLYGIDGWLDMLIAEDTFPYAAAAPMYDMAVLNAMLSEFADLGYTIGVISWTSKSGSNDYNKAVRRVKREWLAKHLPIATEIHVVKYGTPKWRVANVRDSILIDDEDGNRSAWRNGATIDANEDIITQLWNLLETL